MRTKRSTSLRSRFVMSMGVMLVPLLTMLVVGFWGAERVLVTLNEVARDLAHVLAPVQRLHSLVLEAPVPLYASIAQDQPDLAEQFVDSSSRVNALFRDVLVVPLDEKKRQPILNARQEWERTRSIGLAILALPERASGDPRTKELFKQLADSTASTAAQLENIASLTFHDIQDELNIVKRVRFQTTLALFAVFGLGLLASAVAVFTLSGTILRPVKALEAGAKRLGAGDLESQITLRRTDELGKLAETFNQMAERIAKSRKTTHESEEQLEREKEALTASNRELSQAKVAILNILDDVEEHRKRTDAERRRFEAILAGLGEGVYVVDDDDRIRLFNDAAQILTGYSALEVTGEREDEALHLEDANGTSITKDGFPETYWRWKTGRISSLSNLTLGRKNGARFPAFLSVAPIRTEDGKVVGGVVAFRDVTREREIDRMKSEFVSVASHQLRTPLSAIKWFLEMVIGGDAGKVSGQQRDFLERAYDSNERMIHLVNDLLNVSRIESGKLRFEPRPTDLLKITQEVASELAPLAAARNVHMEIVSTRAPLPPAMVDPEKIREVIVNLVSNAVKYTMARGRVTLSLEPQGRMMRISVRDTGIGIPASEQGKVFEKFFRAGNVRRVQTEGSGLGLYIVKALVESSGGKISFTSEESKGTTFVFTVPLASAA